MRFKQFLPFLLLIVPFFIIYKSLFLNSSLSWGDAPFFYPQNLKQLFFQPLLWDTRNDNFGAMQGFVLWLYLPTFLIGLFSKLGLSYDYLVKIIFYWPAVIFSLYFSFKFLRRKVNSSLAAIVGSFFYGFNTYFLLIVDGGQIGLALAYGLFPLMIDQTSQFLDTPSRKLFLLSLLSCLLVSNTDIRLFLIGVFFLAITSKRLTKLGLLLFSTFLVNLFWIIPFVLQYFSSSKLTSTSSQTSLISMLDGLTLFQPHFPLNEFGNLTTPPFYFVILPILVIVGLIISKSDKKVFREYRRYFLLYLLFAFLAKGQSEPFGEAYLFLVNKIPLGFALRDSSKFYIPLILSVSFLISLIVARLVKFNNRNFSKVSIILIFLFLMLMIYPALLGQLTGNLGNNANLGDYQFIYQQLNQTPSFFRTIWFPEKSQYAFSTWNNPAISADTLYQERPFASQIEGTYDLFNYLHQPKIKDWFKLLGIKYVFFPESPRKKVWSQQERADRVSWINFIWQLPGFQKTNWPLSFPSLSLDDALPHIFGQRKAFVVVGDEDIYQQLYRFPGFNLGANGFIFTEQGNVDLNYLTALDKESLDIIFNKTNPLALTMGFLKDQLVSASSAFESDWALRESSDYLRWKYELSNFGIRTSGFDYGKGIAFSSVPGEDLTFNLKIPRNGNYYLMARSLTGSGSAMLKVQINQQMFNLASHPSFNWTKLGPFNLKSGTQKIRIINQMGTSALNTLGLIDESDWQTAQAKSSEMLSKFNSFDIDQATKSAKLQNELSQKVIEVKQSQIDPTNYQVKLEPDVNWLVFSDRYNQGWQIKNAAVQPLPFYGLINGFYVNKLSGVKTLEFYPQKYINLSIILSIVSLMAILAGVIFKRHKP